MWYELLNMFGVSNPERVVHFRLDMERDSVATIMVEYLTSEGECFKFCDIKKYELKEIK